MMKNKIKEDKFDKKDKDKDNLESYKCEECGIDFGNSLGDMEVHKLTEHLQKGDMEIK